VQAQLDAGLCSVRLLNPCESSVELVHDDGRSPEELCLLAHAFQQGLAGLTVEVDPRQVE
jgi:hypothetical protein